MCSGVLVCLLRYGVIMLPAGGLAYDCRWVLGVVGVLGRVWFRCGFMCF